MNRISEPLDMEDEERPVKVIVRPLMFTPRDFGEDDWPTCPVACVSAADFRLESEVKVIISQPLAGMSFEMESE